MDSEPSSKRNKKSDKAKRNKELTGTYSQRHIRLAEARQSKSAPQKSK